MLMLLRGARVSDVARTLCSARSSVGRWINWFTLSGVEGLKSLPAGGSRRWPFEYICILLRELIQHSPGDFGYQRSRWSTVKMKWISILIPKSVRTGNFADCKNVW
ncbi:putative transposase [Escherichia coli]|nr:putative transposase [Escherichia coli]